MNIKEEERKLFDNWKKELEQEASKTIIFNEDGIVDSEKWNASQRKLLFVLKDTNGLQSSLTEFLANGGRGTGGTWNNVSRWADIVLNGCFSAGVDNEYRKQMLSQIAVLNLKKVPGKAVNSWEELNEFTIRNADKLNQQLNLINPDVIIVGGSGTNWLFETYVLKSKTECRFVTDGGDSSKKIEYYSTKLNCKKVNVISMPHPSRCAMAYSYLLLNCISKIFES